MSGSKSSRRFPGSSRTPTFQPPSYYAAAAGLQYPTSSNADSSAVVSRHPMANVYPAHPTVDPYSDSAREDNRKVSNTPRSGRHTVSLSRSLLPGAHGHREEKDRSSHGKRQSQIVDIPFMETTLLPSLRDTIDKMTHPPPQMQLQDSLATQDSDDFGPSSGPSYGVSSSSQNAATYPDVSRPLGLSPGSILTTTAQTSRARTDMSAPSGSSGLRTPQVSAPRTGYSTPKVSFACTEVTSPVTSTEISKTPRSALKGSRTPRALSPNPAQVSISPGTPGRSLRSIKSIIGSKQSTSTQLTPNIPSSSQFRSSNMLSPARAANSASLQPDTIPATTPRAKNKMTLSAVSPNTARSSPSRCNIPRPKFAGDSISDIENEYGNPSGKLVVANAVVEASSSDSEASESRGASGLGQTRLRTPKDLRPGLLERINGSPRTHSPKSSPIVEHASAKRSPGARAGAVGLGFRFYNDKYQPQATSTGVDIDDDRSIYDDTDNEQAPAYARDEDYSDTVSRHYQEYTDESIYTDFDEGNEEAHLAAYVAPHRDKNPDRPSGSRSQALASLIDGIQAEFGFRHDTNRLSRSDSEEQFLIEGVAVSGSQEHNPVRKHDVSANRSETKQVDVQEMRKRCSFRSRSRHDQIQPTQALPMTSVDPGSTSSTTAPSRKSSRRRDSRSSSAPPTEPSVAHQDSGRHRRPSGGERDVDRSGSRSKPLDLKSRHRLSASLGRLNETYHNQANTSQLDGRQENSLNRRNSARLLNEGGEAGNRSGDIIMREREAFGIPASLSYNGIGDSPDHSNEELEDIRRNEYIRSESENSLSSVEELCRVGRTISTPDDVTGQDVSGILSRGAEALFRNLSTGSQGARRTRRQSHRNSASNGTQSSKASRRRSSSVPQLRDVRCSSSPIEDPWPPLHGHDHHPIDSQLKPGTSHAQSLSTWRSRMNPSTYKTLLSKHGSTEIQRQELLYEQYLSQQELVARLRSIVRVFILPLRRKHSKSWIPGVPTLVTRLFDWLEDIVNLHSSVYEALQIASRAWDSGIIVHIAQSLRGLIPQFEIYQPYLVRVEEVRDLLNEHSANTYEEFREFVKLRERHVECGGWTLVDLLSQPVVRLCEFTPVFEKLLSLTPPEHPDHLSTFSLYYSTRMMVYVLYEVKAREEEYDLVKDIASRLDGLPSSVQLAKRERRLLWQGQVVLSTTSLPQGLLTTREESLVRRRGGKDKLSDAGRRDCKTTADPVCTTPHAFVFTDALLLAHMVPDRAIPGPGWRLFPHLGISRVVRVEDRDPFSLSLLSSSASDLQTGMIPEGSAVSTVRISLPDGNPESRAEILSAFRQCYAYTLRSLSFPSHTGSYMPHGLQVDFEHDTQQSVMAILNSGLPLPKSPSVQVIDLERLQAVGRVNDTDQEREERGWWALRFHQVLKEVQRQDPMLALQAMEKSTVSR